MPHIVVMADGDVDLGAGSVMLRERITPSDLQSRHFANYLIERLRWAVEDARALELRSASGAGTGTGAQERSARELEPALEREPVLA